MIRELEGGEFDRVWVTRGSGCDSRGAIWSAFVDEKRHEQGKCFRHAATGPRVLEREINAEDCIV